MPNQQTDGSRVAVDWIKLHYLSDVEQERSGYAWASDKLFYLVRDDPEAAWTVMENIRRLDSSDLILANLAAGPLENLLVQHGDEFIERIEALAKNDPIFRKMLGAVWQNVISGDVWARLKAVAGPSF